MIRDPREVDVKKWAIPEDSHLLRAPAAFREEIIGLFNGVGCQGDAMPADKTLGNMQFRPGEVSIWVGYKESFKSTFLNELVTFWACTGINVALASLEMPAPILLQKTIRQALAIEAPTVEQIDRAIEVLSETMTIYDVTGRLPPNHLIAIMRYCAIELGSRHFVLDNLTMILSVDNDRAADSQKFVSDCMSVAKATGMHIHLVAHTHKPEGGDENRIPTGYNLRGTGAAADQVDNILVVWRNKKKETKEDDGDYSMNEEPDVCIVVDKQRHWHFRGRIKYWLNRRVLRFLQYGNEEAKPFL